MDNSVQSKVASLLLKNKAVVLSPDDPFTYASGIKSPIYCDNRVLISSVDGRQQIVDAFLDLIEKENLYFDVVAGTATAGIAWAAWIADALSKPMVYIRSKAKEHGKGNQIEGRLPPESSVLLVEDLISTGGSSLSAIHALKEAEANVKACVAIFTYEMKKADQSFQQENIPVHTLSKFSVLVEEALRQGEISVSQKELISTWNKNPENW